MQSHGRRPEMHVCRKWKLTHTRCDTRIEDCEKEVQASRAAERVRKRDGDESDGFTEDESW